MHTSSDLHFGVVCQSGSLMENFAKEKKLHKVYLLKLSLRTQYFICSYNRTGKLFFPYIT